MNLILPVLQILSQSRQSFPQKMLAETQADWSTDMYTESEKGKKIIWCNWERNKNINEKDLQ